MRHYIQIFTWLCCSLFSLTGATRHQPLSLKNQLHGKKLASISPKHWNPYTWQLRCIGLPVISGSEEIFPNRSWKEMSSAIPNWAPQTPYAWHNPQSMHRKERSVHTLSAWKCQAWSRMAPKHLAFSPLPCLPEEFGSLCILLIWLYVWFFHELPPWFNLAL